MKQATAKQTVAAALSLLAQEPPITYSQMDCQKFVRECVHLAGGEMRYAGSNDMYRNACTWTGTLGEARGGGHLVPGALLFIVERDGGEPAQYQPDGLGNASHVGLYCADPSAEVAHSSASRGQVAASTLQNGWTHVGLAKAIAYDAPEVENSAIPETAVVNVPEGEGLRMRKAPAPDGEYMLRIPSGTRLSITARQNGYAQTTYGGFTGWVSGSHLAAQQAPAASTDAMDRLRAIHAALGAWIGEVAR